MNPEQPAKEQRLMENTAHLATDGAPVSESSMGFELDSSASIPAASQVVRSTILSAFHLSQQHPVASRIAASLSVIDDGATPRNPAVEQALGFLFSNPQALPMVRERLDRKEEGDFTIETSDGRKFYVITPIGKGGFGAAYLVEDDSYTPEDRRHTQVIKQLTAVPVTPEIRQGNWVQGGPDPQNAVPRFNREAAIARDLTEKGMGPMTPRYIGRGERLITDAEGVSRLYPFIQYEFTHCLPLDQFRQSGRGTLALPAFRDLAAHIAGTVHAFHESGYVHRDVKPGNFLVRSDGSAVMIIDFGLAKERAGDQFDAREYAATQLTNSQLTFGTSRYMAPEQWGGAAKVTPAADWYSVYLVLYHTLTGEDVFRGENHTELYRAHLTEEPVAALHHLRTLGLHPDIVDLFRRGFSKNAQDRPAGEEALQVLLKHSSYRDTTPSEFIDEVQRGDRPLRIPEKVRTEASRKDAPFLSGFPDRNGDRGASQMFEVFSQYPEQTVHATRGSVARLLWPTVAVAGVALTAAGLYGVSHRMADPRSNHASAAGTDLAHAPHQNAEQAPAPFPRSARFEGIAENGRLMRITILKGTPAECSFDAGHFTAHSKDGMVYAVTMHMPEEAVARYVGVRVDQLPQKIRDAHGTVARIVMRPETHQYVLAIDTYGMTSSDGEHLHVYSDAAGAQIRRALGLPADTVSEGDCLIDKDVCDVVEHFPGDSLDAPSDSAREDQDNVRATVNLWKQFIEQRRKQTAVE